MQSLALHSEVKSYDKMKHNTCAIERASGSVLWEAAVQQYCSVKGCGGKVSFCSVVELERSVTEGVEVKYIVSKCRRAERVLMCSSMKCIVSKGSVGNCIVVMCSSVEGVKNCSSVECIVWKSSGGGVVLWQCAAQ